jgi:hypothetical protein
MSSRCSIVCCIQLERREGEDKIWWASSKSSCSILDPSIESWVVVTALLSLGKLFGELKLPRRQLFCLVGGPRKKRSTSVVCVRRMRSLWQEETIHKCCMCKKNEESRAQSSSPLSGCLHLMECFFQPLQVILGYS